MSSKDIQLLYAIHVVFLKVPFVSEIKYHVFHNTVASFKCGDQFSWIVNFLKVTWEVF